MIIPSVTTVVASIELVTSEAVVVSVDASVAVVVTGSSSSIVVRGESVDNSIASSTMVVRRESIGVEVSTDVRRIVVSSGTCSDEDSLTHRSS